MADNSTRIVLTAEDKTAAAIASARANLSGLQAAAAGVTGALSGLGAGVSLAGLAAMVKGSIDAADAMNDLSQRVGISVRELAKYELAAKQSGTSMESIARGVKSLAGNMLEHSVALKAAGVSARDADGALVQLADLFSAMPDGIEKATLATKLFGKSGMDLLPMLNMGSQGLAEAAEKSAEYGRRMAELAPMADKFNDQMAELSLQSKSVGLNISTYFLPGLIGLSKWLNDVAAGGEKAQQAVAWMAGDTAMRAMVLAGHPMLTGGASRSVSGRIGGTRQPGMSEAEELALGERNAANLKAMNLLGALGGTGAGKAPADPYGALIKQVHERTAALQAEAIAEEKLTEAQKFALKVMVDLRDGSLKLSESRRQALAVDLEALLAAEQSAKLAEAARKAEEEYRKEQAKRLQDSIKAVDSLSEQIERQRRHNEEIGLTAEELARLSDARDAESIAAKEQELAYARLHSTSAAEIELLQDEIDKLQQLRSLRADGAARQVMADANKKAAEDWKRFTEDIEQSLTDALMRGFENGNSFGENFVKTLKRTLETAALKIAVQAVVNPVMSSIGGALGGGAGGGFNLPGIPGGGGLYDAFAMSGAGQSLGLSVPYIDALGGTVGLAEGGVMSGLGSGIGAALPWVGGALALASMAGVFDGEGDAMRSGRYFSPFAFSNGPGDPTQANNADGSRYNWLNNSWFSADMQASLDAFDTQMQETELQIAAKLGLQAKDWEAINTRLLGSLGDKRYNFGMEHTDVGASGVFDQIRADRLQAIADALGMSLKDLQDTMSGAKKSAQELARETQKLSAEQNKAKAQALLAGMGATLGAIDSVTGLRSGILSSIAGIRGGNSYDSRMSGLQALLAGETDIGRQVELAGQMKDLVLERYQTERSAIQANQSAAEEAAAAMRAGLISIGAYARSLLLSDLSPLTAAQRLAESENQFNTTLMRARQGDASAIGSLSGAAGTYLQESRGYYASSARYSDVFGSVQGALAQLGLSADSVTATGDWQAQLLAVDNAAADRLGELAGFTEEWTLNLENLLIDQTRQFEGLGLKLTDVADNTRGLDQRIAVLIDTALGARFDKLATAVEKSAATTARAVVNAVQVTVRS